MTTKFISAQKQKVSQPLPLKKSEDVANEENYRIWIGNVDPAINEFSLLQLLKGFGSIKEIDYLFHKSGPNQGKSRGFHFATFCSKCGAEKAIQGLNGKRVFSKTLQVRWAHQQSVVDKKPVKVTLKSDLVKGVEGSELKSSKVSVINSIEQKLKEMEESKKCSTSSSGGLHPLLQQAKANEAAEEARKRMHPYRKPHSRRR